MGNEIAEAIEEAINKLQEKVEELNQKLTPVEPYCEDGEDLCPYCREEVAEMRDDIQCSSCRQVLDWR